MKARLLEVGKDECLIPDNRASPRDSVLRLRQRVLRPARGLRASKRWLRRKPYNRPCQSLVPDCVTTLMIPADARPYSADAAEVMT